LVASLVLVGCGRSTEYDASVAELRDQLWVEVTVLGSAAPSTARQVRVRLVPGPGGEDDAGFEHCPRVAAKVTVAGVEATMTGDGHWNEEVLRCGELVYELPVDDVLRLKVAESARIEIADGSGSIAVQAEDFLASPQAVAVGPAGDELKPGSSASFRVSPSSVVLPGLMEATYHAEDVTRSFGMTVLDTEGSLMVLAVPPDAAPSTGRISVSGSGWGQTFKMEPSSCEAQRCTIERGLCSDKIDCKSGYYDGPSFDELSIPAQVVDGSAP
jgi:hypothetical protein